MTYTYEIDVRSEFERGRQAGRLSALKQQPSISEYDRGFYAGWEARDKEEFARGFQAGIETLTGASR